MLRQFELVEAVRAYDPTADEALLNRAYVYAMKMHVDRRQRHEYRWRDGGADSYSGS